MKNHFLRAIFCFLVIPSFGTDALGQELPNANPEDVGVSSDKVEELSTYMQSLVNKGKIAGGVTMMARRGTVVHLKAVGMADREAGKEMKTNAIFRIASMTKPIISVAVMKLYDQGKLKLDDPVSKFIPEFANPKVLVGAAPLTTRPAKREITIRDLLTHTSGLGYEFTETAIGPIYREHGIRCGSCTTEGTLKQMIEKLGPLPLSFDPGTDWQYGMNMSVLGRVVEVVSGTTLDRFIEEEICRPLRMNDTFFKIPKDKLPRLAAAYVPQEGSIRELKQGEMLKWKIGQGIIMMSSDFPYSDAHTCFLGCGGLCSTPLDYMRFCQMLLNGGVLDGTRLLREETVKMMTINQVRDLREEGGYGFGLGVTTDTEDVHELLKSSFHWAGGWSTSFRISPRGNWMMINMAQLVWDDKATPTWFVEYEKLAADAVMNGAPQ